MAIEVKLPNLGDGVDTGDVLELLVKEGDIVAKDQGLIELETGKATLQVPSSAAGKVSKIHVHLGQTIPPGTLLVTLEGAESAAKPAEKAKPKEAAPATEKKAAPKQEPAPKQVEAKPSAATEKSTSAPTKSAPEPRMTAPAAEPQAAPLPEPTHDGSVPAGPAVRRFAREVGVDLGRVTGSGPSGRITREDVYTH